MNISPRGLRRGNEEPMRATIRRSFIATILILTDVKRLRLGLAALTMAGLTMAAGPAFAGPTRTFSVSEGTQPSNVGVITLTQINPTTVDVLVDLIDTSLPAPQYGFVNTGGPHTPFAFTLLGTEAGVSASFIQPAGGAYTFGLFSLSTSNGGDTPFGTFGVSIDSTAGNGSANAYFGDLEFQLTRTSGLDTMDFITNAAIDPGSAGPAYFAADLTNGPGGNTGAQAWKIPDGPPRVPEPTTLGLMGTGLLALFAMRKFRRLE